MRQVQNQVNLARQVLALGPLSNNFIHDVTGIPDLQDPQSVIRNGNPQEELTTVCAMVEMLRLACQGLVAAVEQMTDVEAGAEETIAEVGRTQK